MTSNNTAELATQGIGNICHNMEARESGAIGPGTGSRVTRLSVTLMEAASRTAVSRVKSSPRSAPAKWIPHNLMSLPV